ncbi:MAG: hypothetical protein ABEK12_01725, partial [Candidatus Nanohaloarchaea archaeon]
VAAEEVMDEVLSGYAAESGLSFTLVAEEVGERVYGDDPEAWIILDIVDGSREIGADLGAAYSIGGTAPGPGRPTLADVEVAAQTELMPTKQWIGDQFVWSGDEPVHRQFVHAASGVQYRDPPHDFVQPGAIEDRFWCWCRPFQGPDPVIDDVRTALEDRVLAESDDIYPATYISTAAQLANLATGRYTVAVDLRPAARRRGATDDHVARPYDLAASRIFDAMQVPIYQVDPDAGTVREGVRTDFGIEEPVAWIAYANPMIEETVHDELCDVLTEMDILA